MPGIVLETYQDTDALARAAADTVVDRLQVKPDLVLCVATGSSPTKTYAQLAKTATAEQELFKAIRILKLDEWLGLPQGDPGTCEHYIQKHLLAPLHVLPDRYIAFDPVPADPAEECARIRDIVREIGIDIAVLGIGADGHIGLNNPADSLPPFTHVADLGAETQNHAMLVGERPTGGMTLGMAELLAAKTVLLLAPGDAKRPAVDRLRDQNMSTQFPGSLLWLGQDTRCLSCPSS